MSFSINTNTAALGALYSLTGNDNMLSQSIQRLSTGLQINTCSRQSVGPHHF